MSVSFTDRHELERDTGMETLLLGVLSPIEGPTCWLGRLLDSNDVLLEVLFSACLSVDDTVVYVGVDIAGLSICVVAIGSRA